MSATFPSRGGSGSVVATAGSGCAWTAVSNASWITITGGASGGGNGAVAYSVVPYTGHQHTRTGTMTIAGRTVTVKQSR